MRNQMIRCAAAAAMAVVLAVPVIAGGDPTASAREVQQTGRGALFGSFPGPNRPFYPATNANYVNGLPELGVGPSGELSYLPAMQRWQGRRDHIINMYSEWAGANAFLFGYWLPQVWNTYHAIPMITLYGQEPNATFMSNASLARGDYDEVIRVWASELRQFITGTDASGHPAPPGGRRAYIRFAWEGNAAFAPWSAAGGATTCEALAENEQAYVAMWRHVRDLVMSTGGFSRDQVAWVFSVFSASAKVPAGCPGVASDLVRAMYPGDQYVDWVGIDGYGGYPWNPTLSPRQLFDPMVTKLRSITNRPLSINEAGSGTLKQAQTAPVDPPTVGATPAQKGAWIAEYFQYVADAGIKMTLWFNVDKEADWAVFSKDDPADPMSRGDCTYADSGTTFNTYCEYAAGVQSRYFLTADPDNPRVLTDSQFLARPSAAGKGKSGG
jgi:mannan endo-1,4-beta-mannosidase